MRLTTRSPNLLRPQTTSTHEKGLDPTNAIENTLGTVRRVTRNVKRWRGGAMVRRWVAAGLLTAEKRFRRIKGHREMPSLLLALRPKGAEAQGKENAA